MTNMKFSHLAAVAAALSTSFPLQAFADSLSDIATRDTRGVTSSSADWTAEDNYWRSNYASRPYYHQDRDYNAYQPAYRYGMDVYNRNPGKRYEDLDAEELQSNWATARGNSDLGWNDAQEATRDAYNRLYLNSNTRGSVATDIPID